jgi:CO/xanthine dehydrogenase Mo-binding subunit
VTLHIGTQSTGQGHQTAYAQFVAGPLGLDYDRIRVVQGDTEALARGGGTGGSRSIPIGVPSVDGAARKLAEEIRKLAADQLEAGIADIELVDGQARVVGTDRAVSYADIAKRAPKPQLTVTHEVKLDENTYPNGTHVCEVEIDPERASDMPTFHFETRNVPGRWNVMGIKGAGEAGSVGSSPAVMNAIVDALHRAYGIRNLDMPATPLRVWEAIRKVRN